MSSQDDADVAPYKNQGINQEKRPTGSPEFQKLLIFHHEKLPLKEWNNWLNAHPNFNGTEILESLRTDRGYWLPTRYPKEEDKRIYEDFFKAALATQGFRKWAREDIPQHSRNTPPTKRDRGCS